MEKKSIDVLRDELIQIENRNGVPRRDADFCLTLAMRACREAVEEDRAGRLVTAAEALKLSTEKAASEQVGRLQAEAEIADWLEGQATAEEEAGSRAIAEGRIMTPLPLYARALRQAAEAVRQGRARRKEA
jgi:hypothetical protein